MLFIDHRQPTKMLNTHCHIDHVLGNLYVSEKYGVDLYIHLADLPTLQAIDSYAHIYGMGGYKTSPLPSHHLSEGDLLKLGDYGLDILFVPGHAPGHVAFVSKEQKWVINGDCLFQGSIGRTDLPGGDFETLTNSIKVKLYSLPDEYTVYCGHGSETTIGFEKRNNPFVKG